MTPASEQEAAGALQQHHGGATAALHSGPGGQAVAHVVPRCQGPRGHASLGGQANSDRRGQDQLLFLLCGRIVILWTSRSLHLLEPETSIKMHNEILFYFDTTFLFYFYRPLYSLGVATEYVYGVVEESFGLLVRLQLAVLHI